MSFQYTCCLSSSDNATYIRSLVLGYGRNSLQVNIRQNTVMLMGKDSQLTDISTEDCVPVLQGFASYIDSGMLPVMDG